MGRRTHVEPQGRSGTADEAGRTAHSSEELWMSDHAAPVPIADERTRRIFGDLSFSSAKRGFDPAEVTAFLVNASGAVERMLGRLKEAEQRAETAEVRLSELEERALQLPSPPPAPPAVPAPGNGNGLLDRTLALAEKTAIAAVADARGRAQAIFFFNDTPTTEIYTLALHDALPI